jgi:glycosyltransferase involved in cell wall biosynthesis
MLPWLTRGGADLVAIHHINHLTRDFGAKVLVITTENRTSAWLDKLPTGTVTIELGAKYGELLSRHEQQMLLTRLLIKLRPSVIHNVNCAIAWELYVRYGRALSSQSKLFASIFGFDYTKEMEPISYADLLNASHQYITRVMTDSQWCIDRLKDIYGIADNLFVRFRYPQSVNGRFEFQPGRKPRILWAGRFAYEKRPDILRDIARRLPDIEFDVFGAAHFDMSDEIAEVHKELSKLSNVHLKGAYDGFNSIPIENYAILLYTTQWDGLPNVILESLASGLVVLAPDVGGIGEIVHPESGFLLGRFDDVSSYVKKIEEVLKNPSILETQRTCGMAAIAAMHSPDAFNAALASLPEYVQ